MDLTRPVTYRGFDLNDVSPQVGKAGLTGRRLMAVEMSQIGLNQYMDKASQHDGMDFQGIGNLEESFRQIELNGVVYGPTRPEMWDALVELRIAMNPVQAYAEDEDNEGYLPLAFSVPTGLVGATIAQYVLARPTAPLTWEMDRDAQGTNAKVAGADDDVALGLPWKLVFNCRDPRIYGSLHAVAMTGAVSGSWTNAGDYPSLVDLTFVVGGGSGVITTTLGSNTPLIITVPAGNSPRTIRYRGRTKLLTVLDPAIHATNEILRQDFLSFGTPNSDTQHPLIMPGSSAYAVATTIALASGSSIAFTDAYA